jgi:transposase
VPDNLRSGVTKAHRYEPDINPSYRDLAEHYGVAVVPRVRANPRTKPRSKSACKWSSAGSSRRCATASSSRWRTQHGNRLLLERLNQKPFKKLPGSRRSAFETIDQPALQPLPEHPYVYAEWKKARVHIDYHVEVEAITTRCRTSW